MQISRFWRHGSDTLSSTVRIWWKYINESSNVFFENLGIHRVLYVRPRCLYFLLLLLFTYIRSQRLTHTDTRTRTNVHIIYILYIYIYIFRCNIRKLLVIFCVSANLNDRILYMRIMRCPIHRIVSRANCKMI